MDKKNKPVVLIVDDEPINIDLLREALKDDYKLIIATRGIQAITMAEQKLPDIILMDIMMPEMDGYEACEKIKENKKTRHIPIIFVSALNELEDRTVGFEMGAVGYITKPFEVKEVYETVKLHITVIKQAKIIEELKIQQNEQPSSKELSQTNIKDILDYSGKISGTIQIIKLFWTIAGPIVLRHKDEDTSGRVSETVDKLDQMIASIVESSRNIIHILESAK